MMASKNIKKVASSVNHGKRCRVSKRPQSVYDVSLFREMNSKQLAILKRRYRPCHLDFDPKPADNETCIVFGDGADGVWANYCAAIDQFIFEKSARQFQLNSMNPREFLVVSDLLQIFNANKSL